MKSVQALGTTIATDDLARVPELTGRVWESCKAVASTPKSNCIASKRSMLQCISVLNDTIKELKEFLSEQASGASESLVDVEDEDEFAFDSSLSDHERALFESGVKLLDMTVAILKRGVLTLKNLPIEDSQQELIAWTATLDRSYKAIQDAVVDVGAALYPPVDVEELTAAVAAAEAKGVAGLECLLAQPAISETELQALGKGRQAFDHQVRTVKTQLEDARAI
jgi:cyclin-D1-binding protein 1